MTPLDTVREALEQCESLAVNEDYEVACDRIAKITSGALESLAALEAQLAREPVKLVDAIEAFRKAELLDNPTEENVARAFLDHLGIPHDQQKKGE